MFFYIHYKNRPSTDNPMIMSEAPSHCPDKVISVLRERRHAGAVVLTSYPSSIINNRKHSVRIQRGRDLL